MPSVPPGSCEKPNGIPNPGSSSLGERGKIKKIKVLDAREEILVCALSLSWDAPGKSQKMSFSAEIRKAKVTDFPVAANRPLGFIGIYNF